MKLWVVIFPTENCDLKTDEEVLEKVASNPKDWVVRRLITVGHGLKEVSASIYLKDNIFSSFIIPYSVTKSLVKRKLIKSVDKTHFIFKVD